MLTFCYIFVWWNMGRKKIKGQAVDPAAITFEMLKDKIDLSCLEYEQSLPDGSGLNNINVFNGMIYNIGVCVFNNIDSTCFNVSMLQALFDYYVLLCNKYNKHPYIMQYCLMINIDYDTFNKWHNGITKASPERLRFCNKCMQTCEQSQISDQNVKSMFLLKAVYGYVEASQPITIQHEIRQDTTNLIDKYKDYPQLIDNKQDK